MFVGHETSQIIIDTSRIDLYGDDYVLTDLSQYVGRTENWETGLISIDVISTDGETILFLASYTDKEINLTISIFNINISSGELRKEKDLFVSPQNGGEDTHHCGNIERFNENTWIFCVGDQDTLYALNENSLRTDLYSGKLMVKAPGRITKPKLDEINNNTIIFTHAGLLEQSFEVESTTSKINISRILIFSILALAIYFFGRQVIKSK